jgi:RsiW-degrading membrane proteinase PrsW (M82 family)
MALWTAHRPVERSLLYGGFISFLFLGFSHAWEFGQKPYWFWIGGLLLGLVIVSITSSLAFTAIRKPENSGVRETKYAVVRASFPFCNERLFRKFFTEGRKI